MHASATRHHRTGRHLLRLRGSNPHGLHIKSRWDADGIHLIAQHAPEAHFTGWPDLVYGGLIAMLVDCHSNWTAMAYHYRTEQREPGSLPRIDCVTGNLGIKFIKPTPMGVTLTLRARVEGDVKRKTRVVCEIYAGDVLTAIGDSVFVRVDTGATGRCRPWPRGLKPGLH